MKRLAAFLLLFSCGVALLVLLDGSSGPPQRRPVAPEPEPVPAQGEEPAPTTQRVEVRGRTLLEFFDLESGHLRRRLEAEDLQPVGDEARTPYRARTVVLEEFEQGEELALRTVRAGGADFTLDLSGGLAAPELADRGRVAFDSVELVQSRGLPQAPVTIRSPQILAELERGVYSAPTEVLVRVDGKGLSAEGRGLLFEAARSTIEFPAGGTVDLVQGGTRRGVLSTAEGAALVLARQDAQGGEAFGIRTLGPSVLAVEGEVPQQVDAERFTVETRTVEGEVEIERVRAFGALTVSRGEDRFSGREATITFDADGGSRLVIDADAVATVSVQGPAGQRRPLTFRGAEGMVLRDGPQGLFLRMAGPFSVTDATGAQLDVAGVGEGRIDAARTELVMRLEGGTRFRSGETELAMGSAVLRHQAGDLQLLQLEGTLGVEARARAADGDLIELTAEAWSLELRGDQPRVLWADAVGVRSLEGTGRTLAAGRLEDFRWDVRSFLALRGVQWVLPEGSGRGERLVARGDGLEVVGRAEERASLRYAATDSGASVELEAVRIDATRTTVEAWGDVRVDASGPEGVSGMLAEHVRIDQRRSEAGVGSGVIEVLAERVREGVLQREGRSLALEAELLEATLAGDDLAAGPFRASGSVRALASEQTALRLEADALERDEAGIARAVALPGRRIRAEGLLPGGSQEPFRLEADSLELGPERLVAGKVRVELGVALVPLGAAARPVAAPRPSVLMA